MSLDSVTEYALSFSEEAVHLQRRDAVPDDGARPAWRHLGSVEFDSPGFRDECIRLRVMAGGEAVLPVTLIIPDDQILYTTLTVAPGADRERAVGKALDGLTPYPIEDLAFDWDGDGDSVRVAAVARQTLREAREFAAQYGFDGQGFRAMPPEGGYAGEPVFVLDPPARARPMVDPAQAGVTSAGLQFTDEAKPAGRALDLDLGGDVVAEPPVESPTVEPESVPETEPEAEPAADAGAKEAAEATEPGAEPSAPDEAEPDPAAGPVSESISEPGPASSSATEPAVEADVAATGSEPEAAEPAAQVEPEESPPEEPSDEIPVAEISGTPATPEPVESAPVVRHGPSADRGAAPALSPRASAVHERAAGARQARPVGAAPPPVHRPGERGGLVGLVGMLAVLVAGLILIWAFLVPGERGQTLTEAAPARSVPTETSAQVPAQVPAQAPAEAPAPQPAPVEAVPATAPAEASPVNAEAAPASTPAPVRQTVAAPAVPPVRISALTEEEQRRVIVAAAAVAAAVVPPSTQAAAPQGATPAAAASEPARVIAAARPVTAPAPPVRAGAPSRAAAATPSPAATEAPARSARSAPPAAVRLSSSARPQLAPRRSTPQTSAPRADRAPRVPSDPLPYAASQRAARPLSASRPPERVRRAAPALAPAPAAAARPAATSGTTPALRGSSRPPLRPEGSAPEPIGAETDEALTPGEAVQLRGLIRDLGRQGLVLGRMPGPEGAARLTQARPMRKPGKAPATASDAVSPSAIDAALRSATTPPPDKPGRSQTAATPARDSGGLLRGSSRPQRRPGKGGDSATPSASAVDAAVSAAVDAPAAAPAATPGAVRLSALASSPLPPRRGEAPAAAPDQPAAPDPAAAAAPAAAAGPNEAELAARRALDEQLQAQAEARIRARAQADAKAEAQARAQAEARARAQADAEERAARARRQEYKPPEVDNEPEIAATALSKGVSSASVAKAATQSRGMNTGRTTIIGIIGAGQASRALIRLRNGKVVTVRLGDRIDGGTINSIGDGRLTYLKAGRTHELRMLDGR